ncbi:MAG: Universal stress protein UspA [Rickettsiaceae bacterium]|jgi:universal stress protein F|nr:Universal stress protein UspA [Rickettsiaceae bacterium]
MFKNIVIPIDLTDNHLWDEIIATALNIIDTNSGRIHLVNIIPELGINFLEDYLPQEWIEKRKAEAIVAIQKLITNYIPQEIEVQHFVTKGAVSEEVLSYAEQVKANLIIVTSTKGYPKDHSPGPNAKKITKHAQTSVLVLRVNQ